MNIESFLKEINKKFPIDQKEDEEMDRTTCPDEEILARLLEHSLNEEENRLILEHITDCHFCLKILYELKEAVQEPLKESFVGDIKLYLLKISNIVYYKLTKPLVLAVSIATLFIIVYTNISSSPFSASFVSIEKSGEEFRIMNINRGRIKEEISDRESQKHSKIYIELSLHKRGFIYLILVSNRGVSLYNTDLDLLSSSLFRPSLIKPLSEGKNYIPSLKSDKEFPESIIKEGNIYILFSEYPLENERDIDLKIKSIFGSTKDLKEFQKKIKEWAKSNSIQIERVSI